MLPLFKVFSLVVRVFARPIIARTKQAHLKKAQIGQSGFFKKLFVRLGNFQHRWDQKIDSKFMGIDKKSSDFFFKPLNDEVALEKGVEFFYEIVIYTILITFPTYEMYQAQQDSKKKSQQNQETLKNLENLIEETKDTLIEDQEKLEQEIHERHELLKMIKHFSDEAQNKVDDLKQVTKHNQHLMILENTHLKEELAQLHLEFSNYKNEINNKSQNNNDK